MMRLITLLALLGCSAAWGAITVGNTTTSSEVATASITFAHASNCNTLSVQIQSRDGANPTAVTFNGAALTKQVEIASSDFSVNDAIWTLVGAPSMTANIVVTFGFGTPSWAVADAISLCGVDQTTPMDATPVSVEVTSATPSLAITTVTNGAWLVDSIAHKDPGPFSSAGAGQTIVRNSSTATSGAQDSAGSSFKTVTTAGSSSMSWTAPASQLALQSVVAFRPAAGGTTIVNPLTGKGGAAARPITLH